MCLYNFSFKPLVRYNRTRLLSAFAVYAILTMLDSFPECQLPDWKTVVWNVANEIDLAKSSIWSGSQLAKSFYRYGTPVVPGHSPEDIGHQF